MKSFADFGIDLRGRSGTEVKTTCPRCSHTRKKWNYPCLNVNTEGRVALLALRLEWGPQGG